MPIWEVTARPNAAEVERVAGRATRGGSAATPSTGGWPNITTEEVLPVLGAGRAITGPDGVGGSRALLCLFSDIFPLFPARSADCERELSPSPAIDNGPARTRAPVAPEAALDPGASSCTCDGPARERAPESAGERGTRRRGTMPLEREASRGGGGGEGSSSFTTAAGGGSDCVPPSLVKGRWDCAEPVAVLGAAVTQVSTVLGLACAHESDI